MPAMFRTAFEPYRIRTSSNIVIRRRTWRRRLWGCLFWNFAHGSLRRFRLRRTRNRAIDEPLHFFNNKGANCTCVNGYLRRVPRLILDAMPRFRHLPTGGHGNVRKQTTFVKTWRRAACSTLIGTRAASANRLKFMIIYRLSCLTRSAAFAAILSGFALLSSCATTHRKSFSRADQVSAAIPQMPFVRFWGDSADGGQSAVPPRREGELITVLALSGGADDGAYGAGFLSGWTSAGTRPEFTIVTGVSTGSLIAPFAFLGSAYDAQLTSAYTETSTHNIYRNRFLLAIPFATSVATTKPLQQLIAKYYTDALIDIVGSEHRRGRRLFVGTTNLDAQRNVIWNLGAVASSSAPGRYALFRKVLLASSSVPGLFPPVLFDANSSGRPIRELHVDGGAVAGLLSIPPTLLATGRAASGASNTTIYLLVNDRLGGDFQMTRLAFLDIVKRSFAIQVQSALLSGVTAAHLWMQQAGGKYFLTYIDERFTRKERGSFQPDYMRALYSYGLERGKAGVWVKEPPTGDGLSKSPMAPELNSKSRAPVRMPLSLPD